MQQDVRSRCTVDYWFEKETAAEIQEDPNYCPPGSNMKEANTGATARITRHDFSKT